MIPFQPVIQYYCIYFSTKIFAKTCNKKRRMRGKKRKTMCSSLTFTVKMCRSFETRTTIFGTFCKLYGLNFTLILIQYESVNIIWSENNKSHEQATAEFLTQNMGNSNLRFKTIKSHIQCSSVHVSQYCVPVGDQSGVLYQKFDEPFWHVQMFYWVDMWACLSLPMPIYIHLHSYHSLFFRFLLSLLSISFSFYVVLPKLCLTLSVVMSEKEKSGCSLRKVL